LLERLSDSEYPVRAEAARALGLMGEKVARDDVITALFELLSDPKYLARAAAAGALGEMGENAASEGMIAALIKRLSDSQYSVRYEAAKALGKLALKVQPQSKPAIIKLVLPHARNKRRGGKSDAKREAGYVALRALVSAGDYEVEAP
jgi:HEAT repeat protein